MTPTLTSLDTYIYKNTPGKFKITWTTTTKLFAKSYIRIVFDNNALPNNADDFFCKTNNNNLKHFEASVGLGCEKIDSKTIEISRIAEIPISTNIDITLNLAFETNS